MKTPTVPIPDIRIEDTSEDSKTPEAEADGPTQPTAGEEIAEHLVPSLVDTTLVRDDIVKVHYWVISHLIGMVIMFFGTVDFEWFVPLRAGHRQITYLHMG